MLFPGKRLVGPVLIGAGMLFSLANAALATTVNFASTTVVTDTLPKPDLSYSSSGLNALLTVGTPFDISNFIAVLWNDSANPTSGTFAITAAFTFTIPTPSGPTVDGGDIVGTALRSARTIDITWNDPVIFNFQDGTKLSVDLWNTTYSCQNGCNNETFYIGGTFTALNGPTNGNSEVGITPLPAALPLFATGLGALGLLGWRRKRKAQAAA
jgi:hypothetical protein